MDTRGLSFSQSEDPARESMSKAARARYDEIVLATRALYEEKGLSNTSVQDITQKVGVTRSLFYHYFRDKEAVTNAVLDTYISDYLEAVEIWNQQRQIGEIEDALSSAVKLLRVVLFENDSFRIALASKENAELYLEFLNRVADRIARYIVDSTVVDYAIYHTVAIDHVYETFYVLIIGLAGYLRRNPQVDDDILKDIIAQTLHMDRE